MHINDLLSMTVAKGASDLYLKTGGSPVLRINGELVRQEQIPEMTSQDIKGLLVEDMLSRFHLAAARKIAQEQAK